MSIPSTPSFLPTVASPSAAARGLERHPLSTKISSALASWARRRADLPETAIDEFADLVAETLDSNDVDRLLVILARLIAGPGGLVC